MMISGLTRARSRQARTTAKSYNMLSSGWIAVRGGDGGDRCRRVGVSACRCGEAADQIPFAPKECVVEVSE